MTQSDESLVHETTRDLSAYRIQAGRAQKPQSVSVVVERLIVININPLGEVFLWCLPQKLLALGAGYLLTHGIIREPDDIKNIELSQDDPDRVRISLAQTAPGYKSHNPYMIYSGDTEPKVTEHAVLRLQLAQSVREAMQLSADVLHRMPERLKQRQEVFHETGGTHAAAIFADDGRIVSFAEDVARRTAFDKAVGLKVLHNETLNGHGIMLSGRVNFDLVEKCAYAGIELVAGVSAPTTAAIDAADHCNITLCAFVRERRATVFTHRQRISHTA